MTQSLTATVAAEVRAELARQNKARIEIAEVLGLSRTALWSRLRGDSQFSLSELQTLAEHLRVPLTQFLPEGSPAVTR